MRIETSKASFVAESDPDTNYGNNTTLGIVSLDTQRNKRSCIEFDISGAPSTINHVILWLYCYYDSAYTRTHDAKRITSSWVESTITWNNQPSTTDTNKASRTATSSDSGTWVSWDITNLFNDETGSTLGILIRDANEDFSSSAIWYFYSDDYTSKHPYIEINGYYVKTTGDDSKDGKSWAQAWKTINKAATTVADGSYVHIGFGTYDAEPAANKIAPQNIGASGIFYLPETAETGGGTGTVSVEQN